MMVAEATIMRIKRFIKDPKELFAQGRILVKENADRNDSVLPVMASRKRRSYA